MRSASFFKELIAQRLRPNMRLKLTGLSLLMESEWLCPKGHELLFNDTARGGRCARSLSAIR